MNKEFPSAKEMKRRTKESWSATEPEEILEEIEKRSSDGKRYAYFFRCRISKETKKMLKKLKYKYAFIILDGAPGFRISW